jgi:hypothetical protein
MMDYTCEWNWMTDSNGKEFISKFKCGLSAADHVTVGGVVYHLCPVHLGHWWEFYRNTIELVGTA